MLGNEFLCFFDSFEEGIIGLEELDDVADLEDFKVDEHTGDLGGVLVIVFEEGFDLREQHFTQNGSLLVLVVGHKFI